MSLIFDDYESSDWYDEVLSSVGINPTTATGPGSSVEATAAVDRDILESIAMTFDGEAPAWVASDSDYKRALERFAASGVDTTIKSSNSSPPITAESANAKNGRPEERGGILGRLGAFVEKNKNLTEILAKGVAAAAGGNSTKQAAQIAAQSRLDELKLKNEQDQQNNARISASVSGLRTPSARLPGAVDFAKRKQATMTKLYQGR